MVTELVERIGDAGLVSMETDSELNILLLMDDSLELALGSEEGRGRERWNSDADESQASLSQGSVKLGWTVGGVRIGGGDLDPPVIVCRRKQNL